MNRVDSQYITLIENILDFGSDKTDRTGTGTKSVFGYQFRHCMCNGFPLLTTKKMAVKTMMTELKWFLKGDSSIQYLLDNNCHIWDGDAYKAYFDKQKAKGIDVPLSKEEFIDKVQNDPMWYHHGHLGPIYGKQWRSWGDKGYIDQIEDLIIGLKTNPDSRRHLVSAWNVEDLPRMTLPPVTIRSNVMLMVMNYR